MDCRQAQTWMLKAEDPSPEQCGSAAMAQHIRTCEVCAMLARELVRLEQAWRRLPVPEAGLKPSDAVVKRLSPDLPPGQPIRLSFSRRRLLVRAAVAALVFLALGVGTWLLAPHEPRRTEPDLVEHLVSWNLDLARATTAEERRRLYDSQADRFRAALRETRLPPEETKTAANLLDNGAWLAQHDDPLDESERFQDLAGTLLISMNAAAERQNFGGVSRLAPLYGRVVEEGVGTNLAKIPDSEVLDPQRQQQLERVVEGSGQHAEALADLQKKARKAPRAVQKDLDQARDITAKQHKKGKRAKETTDKPKGKKASGK